MCNRRERSVGVDYRYRIGKTEVTVGQYTEFLNAVADTDAYALYHLSMASSLNLLASSKTALRATTRTSSLVRRTSPLPS